MEITIYTLMCWTSAIIIASLAFFIYELGKESRSGRIFSFLAIAVSLWSFSIPLNSLAGVQVSHFLGSVITTIFFLFSISYPDDKKINTKILLLFLTIEISFLYLIFYTNSIISQLLVPEDVAYIGWKYGKLSLIFDLHIFIFWFTGISLIIKKYIHSENSQQHTNLKWVLIALIVGIIPPVVTGIILPRIGIFNYYWLGPVSGLLWFIVITYSIAKHHLFNIKIVTVQLVTFALWIFILVRTVLSETLRDFIIQGSLLFITIIFGVILIRSVLHELKQREQIEKLASDIKVAYAQVKDINEHLEDKIAEQTQDVQRAYEVEKKARAELEDLNKTKDQFITSTQHHLRTPMTALKWELESIRNGTCGPVNQELKQALDNSDASVSRLTNIIENFINITEQKS
jgi:hypothetical protein